MKRLSRRLHGQSRGGFTLLELIVVITIIGILGTLVTMKVAGWIGKAQSAKIKNDLQTIIRTAETYYITTGSYPQSLEEMKNPSEESGFVGGLENDQDPWGNEYSYEVINGKPTAYCYGRDGQQGGEGDDQDYSWPEEQDLGF